MRALVEIVICIVGKEGTYIKMKIYIEVLLKMTLALERRYSYRMCQLVRRLR